MTFQAIVFAPFMRSAARLSIADLEQTFTGSPEPIAVGVSVNLRFGACCPALAEGTITEVTASSGTAVLAVEGVAWTIKRCPSGTGVSIPGMIAENWFVA